MFEQSCAEVGCQTAGGQNSAFESVHDAEQTRNHATIICQYGMAVLNLLDACIKEELRVTTTFTFNLHGPVSFFADAKSVNLGVSPFPGSWTIQHWLLFGCIVTGDNESLTSCHHGVPAMHKHDTRDAPVKGLTPIFE